MCSTMEPWKELMLVALPAVAEAVHASDCGAQAALTVNNLCCPCLCILNAFMNDCVHKGFTPSLCV